MYFETVPMSKTVDTSEIGAAYLAQEANSARFYLPGKAVCVTDSGRMLWYELPEEEMDGFHYDEMVLNEHLSANFTNEELKALNLIRELDRQAQDCLLHVITTRDAGGGDQYAIFYSEPSEAFFKVHLDDLERVNLVTANLMAQVGEPSWLSEPYVIRLDERGVFEL